MSYFFFYITSSFPICYLFYRLLRTPVRGRKFFRPYMVPFTYDLLIDFSLFSFLFSLFSFLFSLFSFDLQTFRPSDLQTFIPSDLYTFLYHPLFPLKANTSRTTRSGLISFMHLKWPSGQMLPPCFEQGRQYKSISIILSLS